MISNSGGRSSESRETAAFFRVPLLAHLLLDRGPAVGRRLLLMFFPVFRVEHSVDQVIDSRFLASMSSAIWIV